MRNSRWAATLALAVSMLLVTAACSNSKAKTVSTTTTEGGSNAPAGTAAPGKHVKVVAPGVTDTEIRVGGVASVHNPLGGKYGDAFVGAKAYFDGLNASGGIYGRKIVLAAQRDDNTSNNKVEVQGLLTEDKVFAVLPVATLLFTGAQTLVDQAIPTFGWTINPEWQGSAKDPRSNLFGQSGSFLCFNCAAPGLPWLAKGLGRHKIGVLAYNVPSSADCADGVRNSFQKYGKKAGAQLAFIDKSLSFGVGDLSVQVSKMKSAGVDLVTTCMDTNGVVTLAKEMKKQQLKAFQYLPNGYDQSFLDDFGDLFEGSIVRTDFVQLEAKEKPKGLQNFLSAMDKAGVKPSENSLVGWINADMFVAGLRGAGPSFSRQKVIDAVNKMTNYRADGILHGVDWTKEHTALSVPGESCQFLSTIHDSKFDPTYSKPGKPFVCAVDQGGQLVTRYDP
ncbi:MAG: ABC transporter substrate-binding protein [Actinomycetota bacterium]|nr:ABC transporter substrate-binding protein [Actinomycetota bacterium]